MLKNNWPVVNWNNSKCDIYIGRPSEFGNKFVIGRDGSRDDVILLHERWILSQPTLIANILHGLKGLIVGCSCAPNRCHGDFLVRIANGWQLAFPLDL